MRAPSIPAAALALLWSTASAYAAGAPVFSAPTAAPREIPSAAAKPDQPSLLDGLAASLLAALDRLGSFGTSISLEVPAFRGLEPALKLSYDSNAGNGVLGVGWSLSAPSAIQRRGQSMSVPAYDATDAFYLDALELILCTPLTPSPGCRYDAGIPGYIYYFTKQESYQRIAFDPGQGHWHVWRTDGVRLDYEMAWLTRGERVPNRWFLTRVSDALGNTVDYAYQSCDVPPMQATFNPSLDLVARENLVFGPPYAPAPPNAPLDPASWTDAVWPTDPLPADQMGVLLDPFGIGSDFGAIGGGNVLHDYSIESDLHQPPGTEPADDLADQAHAIPAGLAWPYASGPDGYDLGGSDDDVNDDEVAARLWTDTSWRESVGDDITSGPPGAAETYWRTRLDRWQDIFANDYTAEYVYLRRISYGRTEITFHLEGRPDPFTFAIGDHTTGSTSCRLHTVDVQTADAQWDMRRVRAYQLEYEQRHDTARSLLVRVRSLGADAEIDDDGNVLSAPTALPDTTLAAAPARHVGDFAAGTIVEPAPDALPPATSMITQDATVTLAPGAVPGFPPRPGMTHVNLDFNGDGLQDHVLVHNRDYDHGDLRIVIQPYQAKTGGGYETLPWVETGVGRQVSSYTTSFSQVRVGDFDGDGRDDLLWIFDERIEPAPGTGPETGPEKYFYARLAITRFDDVAGFVTTPEFDTQWPLAWDYTYRAPDPTHDLSMISKNPLDFLVTDVDGDGMSDMVLLSALSARPDPACAGTEAECLAPVTTDQTWTLVPFLSRGDGGFNELPPVHTGWPIGRRVDSAYVYPNFSDFADAEAWAQYGVDVARNLFRPGEADRFTVADMNGDGRGDIIRIGNASWNEPLMSICTAMPRTSDPAEVVLAPFELGCQEPGLPHLDNRQFYVPGDVNGDGRTDLVRVFETFPGGRHEQPLTDVGASSGDIPFTMVKNGLTAFQTLISDGKTFSPGPVSQTAMRWRRNVEHSPDWREEFWTRVNYSLPGWECTDLDGDARCDMTLLAYQDHTAQFIANLNSYLPAFRVGHVDLYDANPQIDQWSVRARPTADGADVIYSPLELRMRPAVAFGKPFWQPNSATLADHNGDGRADVVNWQLPDNLPVMGNIRTYPFTARVALAEDTGHDVWRTESADVDGDGLTDLVRLHAWKPYLYVEVSLRKADGSLVALPSWQVGGGWEDYDGRTGEFRVGDYNGDGRHDLAMLRVRHDSAGVESRVLLSNGDGSWEDNRAQLTVSIPRLFAHARQTVALDADGDGRTDFVHYTVFESTGCAGARRLRLDSLRSLGDGTFTPSVAFVDLCGMRGRQGGLHVADVNGDGRGDLLGAFTRDDGSVAIVSIFATPAGGWRAVSDEIDVLQAHVAPAQWRTIDLNADRVADLAALVPVERAGGYDLYLLRLRGNGDGTWDGSRERAAMRFPTADVRVWTALDLNDDHRADWVHLGFQPGGVLRADSLVATSGKKPLRFAWTSAGGAARAADAVRARPLDRLEGPAGLLAVSYDHDSDRVLFQVLNPDVAADVLLSARDGLGATTAVTYSTTAALALARPGTTCALPAATSLHVATAVRREDGRSPIASVSSYQLACPRWSQPQRRALGFESVIEIVPAVATRPEHRTERLYVIDEACDVRLNLDWQYDASQSEWQYTSSWYAPTAAAPPYRCELEERWSGERGADGSAAASGQGYVYDEFGRAQWTYEYGDYTTVGDEVTTHRQSTILAHAYHVIEEASEVYDGIGATTLVAANRYCYDSHDPAACTHGPDDPGIRSAEGAWDDRAMIWSTTTTEHDARGNVVAITDANGNTTTTEYDPVHELYPVLTVNALGHETHTEWDVVLGKPLRVIDANGVATTEMTYDALGRLETQSTADGGLSGKSYVNWGDPTQQRVLTMTQDGPGWQFTLEWFDGFGRVYRSERSGATAGSSFLRDWTYGDASPAPQRASQWREVGDPSIEEQFEYDYAGRLIRTVRADGSAVRQDYFARRRVSTDEAGHVRDLRFDAHGHLSTVVEDWRRPGQPAQQPQTHFAYDALGNFTAHTDANGNVMLIHRDSRGRPYQIDDPDLGTTLYDYDIAGNLVRSEDENGAVVTYDFDPLNRLVTRQAQPSGQVVNAVYDDPAVPFSIGRLTALSETGSTCAAVKAYRYDLMGRMTQEQTCVDGVSEAMTYGYDPLGRLATLTYPDGETITHGYDLAGRLTRVDGVVDSIRYDAQDRLREMVYSNGVSEQRSYDAQRGWLTGHSVTSGGTTLFSGLYGYQPDGVPAGAAESLGVGDSQIAGMTVNRTFTHDSLHRLTDVGANADVTWQPGVPHTGPYATAGALAEQIEYDAIGNITFKSGVGSYAYGGSGAGPHAVSTAGGTTFSYDAVGNALSSWSGSTDIDSAYDELGRMIAQTSSTPASGVEVQLGYDPGGQRLRKSVSTWGGATAPPGTTYYFGKHLERTPDGQLVKYYFAGDQLVARRDSTGLSYYHADRLGSTRVVTSASGVGLAGYDYGVFGASLLGNAANARGVLFTGQRHDAELTGATGVSLVYMGARYYDPLIGRFMSADTVVPSVVNPQAWNRYTYVFNAPASLVDPDGHSPKWASIGPAAERGTQHELDHQRAVRDGSPYHFNRDVIARAEWSAASDKFFGTLLNTIFMAITMEAEIAEVGTTAEAGMFGGRLIYSRVSVWELGPTYRGVIVEAKLATTEYSGWYNIGATRGGTFDLVDFQKGSEMVQLKTFDAVNLSVSNKISELKATIGDLAKSGATVSDAAAKLTLDLRVPMETTDAVLGRLQSELGATGAKHGVTVTVSRYDLHVDPTLFLAP